MMLRFAAVFLLFSFTLQTRAATIQLEVKDVYDLAIYGTVLKKTIATKDHFHEKITLKKWSGNEEGHYEVKIDLKGQTFGGGFPLEIKILLLKGQKVIHSQIERLFSSVDKDLSFRIHKWDGQHLALRQLYVVKVAL